MTRKWLCALGILFCWAGLDAQQRWLGSSEKLLSTDGVVTAFPLPNPRSGPTTIALAQDGTLWFTESAGNRIGRMNPDGTGLKEFVLPNPDSSPRIIALGADGNMWFGRVQRAARSVALRRQGRSPSSRCRGRTRGPATLRQAPMVTCGSSSLQGAWMAARPMAIASGASR